MNIIIPICGKGERFSQNGYTIPKPMINIFNKPMIMYVLDNLNISPNDKVFVLYRYDFDESYFINLFSKLSFNVNLIKIEKETIGASETLNIGIKNILNMEHNKKCMVIDGDIFYTQDILSMYRNCNCNAIFYFEDIDKKPVYSYIQLNSNKKIVQIKEKEKISNNACSGAYCFSDIIELLENTQYVIDNKIYVKSEPYTSCVVGHMLKNDKHFDGIMVDKNYVFNLGTPTDMKKYIDKTYCFLFDFDGTIVLTDDIYYDVWKNILLEFNVIITKEIFNKYIFGNSDDNVVRTLISGVNTNIQDISNKKDKLFLDNVSKIKLVENIVSFLDIIKLNGHKMCIVTNCNKNAIETSLKHLKLEKYFDFIIANGDAKKSKPHPDPYLLAIQKYNVDSQKCIIFEDSKSGLLSAKMTNPKCLIGIKSFYNDDKLIQYGANKIFYDYKNIEIKDLIEYTNNDMSILKKNILISLKNNDVVDVVFDNELLKGGYISNVIACNLIFKNGKKDKCVIKMENKNITDLSIMANNLDLYGREYYFYESLSNYVNVKFPKYYGNIKDENFENIGIVMENLNSDDYILNLNLNEQNIDISLKIINDCAHLHSKFWNKDLQKVFPQLKKNNDELFQKNMTIFVKDKWNIFYKNWKNTIGENIMKILENIVQKFDKIQNNLSNEHLTLCHGDVKSPNIFYKKIGNSFDPYFIDWQYLSIGKGIQDIVFFMIESFDTETIKLYYDLFKNYYYIKLIEYGVKNYNKEIYENDFLNAICYFPVFVAIWFGTIPYDELIDKNFPFFFIKKLTSFIEIEYFKFSKI